MVGRSRQGLTAWQEALAPHAAWQSLWSWKEAPELAGGWPQSPATCDFCLHPCRGCHGQAIAGAMLTGTRSSLAVWVGAVGFPTIRQAACPEEKSLCPSQHCLDVVPKLLLPCSKAFNDPAGGWQQLLTPVLGAELLPACSGHSLGSPAWGMPGRAQSQEPVTELGFSLLFRSKLHIKAKCRCCWAPRRRAASFS